ncbi:P-loop NTPase fold protein [Moorena sp. SIO4G3]|uniref:P-loop NTPase fold protein n=1 Tax=Moorena sp. SIO4G3 TaxID=2607821 RepID=UPI00142A3A55|nr:P-loop NTPase fold protein [Moorena sp. SIO4G3]NEO76708.1 AAA family ATPase [Moorena sp. SIO4G3]
MCNVNYWRQAYQLFNPDQPLTTLEEIEDFYVQREDSPVKNVINTLQMEDQPVKFLLAGHRGSGKTTELRRIEQELGENYTVIWVDAATDLNRYNIGYAEVVVLIGMEVCRQAIQPGWLLNRNQRLLEALRNSLRTVSYRDQQMNAEQLELPDVFTRLGLILRRGFTRDITRSLNIGPDLNDIITRTNDIIQAAKTDCNQNLLIIVDGLDRQDYGTAVKMFASSLLTELECHIIYTIPISLRYSPSFRQPMESFQCLDLYNLPVFECDRNSGPTSTPNNLGRDILKSVITKRLAKINETDLFTPDALDLLSEKSGGVIRDLIRLARTACQVAVKNKKEYVDTTIAQEAIQEERRAISF